MPLWFRLILVLSTALLAGIGLARSQSHHRSDRLRNIAVLLAAGSGAVAALSIVVVEVNVYGAALHVLLVSAVPLLMDKPKAVRWASVALIVLLVAETTVAGANLNLVLDTAYVACSVAWLGLAFAGRPNRLVLLGLVAAGLVRLGTSGLAFDRRVYLSALGLVLLAAVLLPVAVILVRNRYAAVGVAAALVAWSAAAAVPAPPELPTPGVAVLVDTDVAPVLVSPHRPGRNLVHIPTSVGTARIQVTGGPVLYAETRPGAEGLWATVDLPAQRAKLVVTTGKGTASVEVDPGDQPGLISAAGADGPECASAALGGLLAQRREVLTNCPADSLSTEDAESLRQLVAFLGSRDVSAIALKQDASPRSRQAAGVVRDAAAAAGIRLDTGSDNALVVVSGWAAAADTLTEVAGQQAAEPVYPHGLYVAPWLLNTPVATAATTVSVPLQFDPRTDSAVHYAVKVGNAFGGERPTLAGFRAWNRSGMDSGVQIYAVAQVTAMPMGSHEAHGPGMPMIEESPGQWIAKATVVPVSAVLKPTVEKGNP